MSTATNTDSASSGADAANISYTFARYDINKKCTHCMRKGYSMENCLYKKEEDEEKQLMLSPCEQCFTMGHIKKRCPLIPDSPRTKSRKYQEYTDREDYHGASEYLQDQLNNVAVADKDTILYHGQTCGKTYHEAECFQCITGIESHPDCFDVCCFFNRYFQFFFTVDHVQLVIVVAHT